MKQVLIATKNKGKIKEFTAMFAKFDIQVISLLDIADPIPDVEETGTTFEENAALKAETIQQILNQPVLADDSGLMVDVLNGKPGVYSARFAGENASDEENNKKLLSELQGVPDENRNAMFVCTLAISIPGVETVFKTGYVNGKITHEPRGENGFGYDPVFIPTGYDETMAELSAEVKNSISHRSAAIKQLEQWVKDR